MARRGTVGTLLASGMVGVVAIGGAGGYALGLLTTAEQAAASGTAAPLGPVPTPTPSMTPSSPTLPPKTVVSDDSKPLNVDDLRYKTREFTATGALRSQVRVRVPSNWKFTYPDPPIYGRYTDPTEKRWIRIEAGFTIRRAPAESMNARITDLGAIPANQLLQIISQTVDADTGDATLVYTYVPASTVRYVIIRWVANRDGLCTFEIASTGLPQDQAALEDVVQHAADSAVRNDSST